MDEGTGVSRQDLVYLLDSQIGCGAEADQGSIPCQDDLLGHENAVGADDGPTLLLFLHKLLDSQAMDLAHDEVEVLHASGPIILGQIDLSVGLVESVEQLIVGLEVQAYVLPHVPVVGSHDALPVAQNELWCKVNALFPSKGHCWKSNCFFGSGAAQSIDCADSGWRALGIEAAVAKRSNMTVAGYPED